MFPVRPTAAAIPADQHVDDAAVDSPALCLPSAVRPAAAQRAGEPKLTQGQKLALLVMRQSDLSKAVLAGVIARTKDGPAGRDFYECAKLGLAINKGKFHVLTPRGRWLADFVATDVARQFGLHIITYFHGDRGNGQAAYSKCTCGWRSYPRSTYNASWLSGIGGAAQAHLAHVAEKAKAS